MYVRNSRNVLSHPNCNCDFYLGHPQAHDEICVKFPMQCKECGKKKIPREKVGTGLLF